MQGKQPTNPDDDAVLAGIGEEEWAQWLAERAKESATPSPGVIAPAPIAEPDVAAKPATGVAPPAPPAQVLSDAVPAEGGGMTDYAAIAEGLADESGIDMTKVQPDDPPDDALGGNAAQLRQARSIQSGLQESISAAARALRKANPEYTILTPRAVVLPKGRASKRVVPALIDRILTHEGAAESQGKIRAFVESQFPGKVVPAAWTKALPPATLQTARERIIDGGVALRIDPKDIKPGTSLADIHRLAKIAAQVRADGAVSFRAEVCITNELLTIAGVPFKVTTSSAKQEKYRYLRAVVPIKKLLDVAPIKRSKLTTKKG